MSDNKLQKRNEFDTLVSWAQGKLTDGSLEDIAQTSNETMRAATLLASRINSNRMANLFEVVTQVESEIVDRIPEMDVPTLMRLRESLDMQIAEASNRIHNPTQQEQNTSNVQLNTLIQPTAQVQSAPINHELPKESRERIQSFLQGIKSLNSRETDDSTSNVVDIIEAKKSSK